VYFHRNTLNDLSEITGGVLRGQRAKFAVAGNAGGYDEEEEMSYRFSARTSAKARIAISVRPCAMRAFRASIWAIAFALAALRLACRSRCVWMARLLALQDVPADRPIEPDQLGIDHQ
jgi:hypothetical protein